MDRLEIEYKFTPKEVFRHHVEFYKERITYTEVLKVLPFTSVVLWGFLIFTGVINIWAYLLVPVLALLSMPLGIAIMMAFVAAKSKKYANGPGVYGAHHKRRITLDGITRPYGNGEVTEQWADMHKLRESEAFYYFYYTKIEYLLIPKSAFKTQEQHDFIKNCAAKIEMKG